MVCKWLVIVLPVVRPRARLCELRTACTPSHARLQTLPANNRIPVTGLLANEQENISSVTVGAGWWRKF